VGEGKGKNDSSGDEGEAMSKVFKAHKRGKVERSGQVCLRWELLVFSKREGWHERKKEWGGNNGLTKERGHPKPKQTISKKGRGVVLKDHHRPEIG